MFVSSTTIARKGTTELFAHLTLVPSLRFVAIHRSGLRYSWWHAPASSAAPTGWVGMNVVLEGTLATRNKPGPRAPTAWLYAEDDFEGSLGARRQGFCACGDPFRSVAIHVAPESCLLDLGPDARPQELVVPRSVFAACEHYLVVVQRRGSADEWAGAAQGIGAALKNAGWLARELVIDTDRPADARISDVLTQIIGRFDPSAQLAELADRTSTTPRRVDRLLRSWMAKYGLPSESWRDVTRRWRLKMAVMLCSSPDYTVAEVAKIVGYQSANAMTNAFAAEKLPPPSWYRTADLLGDPTMVRATVR